MDPCAFQNVWCRCTESNSQNSNAFTPDFQHNSVKWRKYPLPGILFSNKYNLQAKTLLPNHLCLFCDANYYTGLWSSSKIFRNSWGLLLLSFIQFVPTASAKLNILCSWNIKTVLHFHEPAIFEMKRGTKTELIYRQQEEPQSCKSLPSTQMETAASVLLAGYWFLSLLLFLAARCRPPTDCKFFL